MVEIAVVGSEEFVTGFRLAGVRKVHEVSGDVGELEAQVGAQLLVRVGGLAAGVSEDQRHLLEAARNQRQPERLVEVALHHRRGAGGAQCLEERRVVVAFDLGQTAQ